MALLVLMAASAGITSSLSRLRSMAARVVVSVTLATSWLLIQVPWIATRLHLHPLHLDDWLIAIGGGLIAGIPPLLLARARSRNA